MVFKIKINKLHKKAIITIIKHQKLYYNSKTISSKIFKASHHRKKMIRIDKISNNNNNKNFLIK